MSNDPRLALLQESLNTNPYSREVTSLCLRKDDGVREHPDTVEIDIKTGVLGDRWIWRTWKYLETGEPDPRVQIAVCNSRIISLLQEEKNNNYHPGDSIMVDRDLNAEEFPVGAQFKVGPVTLEVTDVYNNACAKFAGEFGRDVLKWINLSEHKALNLRGIYCRIIVGGPVCLGDKLQLL